MISTLAVVVLLLLAIGLPFAVVLSPTLAPDKPGIAAGLALIASALIGGIELWPDPHFLQIPFLLAVLALIPGVAIARSFRRVDMIAILFHRDFGMQGATLAGLKNEITAAVLAAILIFVGLCALASYLEHEHWLIPTATGALILANPFARFAISRLWLRPVTSVLPDRLASPRLDGNAARPDLVIVYLEGTDRQFFDRGRYGPMSDKLADYVQEGLSFTRVGQIAGTGWSLAGMVASQSGVPVPPRGLHFQQRLQDMTCFMPNIRFLGDILADKGYASHYVVGGDTGFGGIGAMYETHQIGAMTGYDELRQIYSAEEFKAAQVEWFLDDQMVLDAARGVHAQLVAGQAPYALIVETIGPHGPKGSLSRRWTASGQAETAPVPKAVGCLLDEVVEFLDDLRAVQARHGRDLRVVILSDHLNHTPSLPAAAPGYSGFNTVILWGDPAEPGREIDKPGSMIDVFPTVLDWLGWVKGPAAAGIGRSLLSDAPTLVEEFGIAKLDRMIVGDASFANLVWDEARSLAEDRVTT